MNSKVKWTCDLLCLATKPFANNDKLTVCMSVCKVIITSLCLHWVNKIPVRLPFFLYFASALHFYQSLVMQNITTHSSSANLGHNLERTICGCKRRSTIIFAACWTAFGLEISAKCYWAAYMLKITAPMTTTFWGNVTRALSALHHKDLMAQCRRALKPDGLLLASFLGGQTVQVAISDNWL